MTRRRRILSGAALLLAAAWVLAALQPPRSRPLHPYFTGAAGGAAADRPTSSLVIAHRGGRHLAPEGTLLLFRQAVDLGVDVLEMDVRGSADGALVVIHDPRVERTTDGVGPVDSLSLEALQALDAGYRFTPDGGATFPFRGQGLRIPTLAQVLDAFPGQRLLLELKAESPDDAGRLCADLRSRAAQPRAIVGSFHRGALDAFRAACPEVATSASSREATLWWLLQMTRLDGLCDPDFDALQVPETWGPFTIVDRRFVERAHARGLPVQVWTVNRRQDMERLLALGVDGLMTDRPDLLLDLLRRERPG